MSSTERLESWLPFFLLLVGSVLFTAGGSFHPHVGTAMGVLGSPEFFTNFAQKMVSTPGWIPMHMLILAGPVMWALAAPSVGQRLPQGGKSIWAIAQTLLVISATLWIITFVLDGFIAPVYARKLLAPRPGGIDPMMLMNFGMNQTTLVRLGLVSLVMNGFAITLYSSGLIASSRRLSWRTVIGVAGILIGVWPFIAALSGKFLLSHYLSAFVRTTPSNLSVGLTCAAAASVGAMSTVRTNSE